LVEGAALVADGPEHEPGAGDARVVVAVEPALEGERFAVERLGLAQLAPELEELRQRDPGVSRGGMEGVRDGLEEGHGLAEKRLGAGVVAPAVADGGEGVEG